MDLKTEAAPARPGPPVFMVVVLAQNTDDGIDHRIAIPANDAKGLANPDIVFPVFAQRNCRYAAGGFGLDQHVPFVGSIRIERSAIDRQIVSILQSIADIEG